MRMLQRNKIRCGCRPFESFQLTKFRRGNCFAEHALQGGSSASEQSKGVKSSLKMGTDGAMKSVSDIVVTCRLFWHRPKLTTEVSSRQAQGTQFDFPPGEMTRSLSWHSVSNHSKRELVSV